MTPWVQAVLGAAAAVTALGVLWTKVFRPGLRAAAVAEEMLPLLLELTKVFRGTPEAFKILDEIAAQFRTDSGSSLRDVVNRLEKSAGENKAASDLLAVRAEATAQLAQRDREQLQSLIITLDRLQVRAGESAAVVDRMEKATKEVAANLAAAQHAVDGVAADLAASHDRADAVRSAPHSVGEVADAAAAPVAEDKDGG